MTGSGLASKCYILPVPQNVPGDEVEIETVISHRGWIDWYHYNLPWETPEDETITLAVSNNSIAFQPMATWAVLPKRETPS
ncbi:hypothetical protein Cpir12675_004022 [Ceratocystis pirilliformis]|uniref:Uncharacterized protein n=1 Tax=Ceratocystis pirilliformis TaxID=259994 RepID=A0ABR3Z043_9PEZI